MVRNTIGDAHAQSLSALQAELETIQTTTTELKAAHAAELEETAAKHSTDFSNLKADHEAALSAVRDDMAKKHDEESSAEVERLRAEVLGLKVELEKAKDTHKPQSDEAIKTVQKEVEDLKDELEMTKQVCYLLLCHD